MAIEQFFMNVVIILATARVLGEVFRKMKQAALVGELLAGMLLGPSLLGILSTDADLMILSNVAVFFVMLFAGLEMDLGEIRKAGKPAIVVSLMAFVIPFMAGSQIASFFGLSNIQSLFMGLLLSITAIPISAIVLAEFGILKSKIGNTVIAAAVINDIFSLVILAILLQLSPNGGQELNFAQIGISVSKIAIFLAEIALLAYIVSKTTHWLPQRMGSFLDKLQTREAVFGILIVLAITVSLIAEITELHFIVGTFFAGLIFSKLIGKKEADRAYGIVTGITFGFFAPLFFGFIGLEFEAQSMINSIPLFLALLAAAIVAKIGGGYVGAKMVKFSNNESIAIGALMNGRGMIELAIASIGYAAGILDLTLFSIAVAIGFVTTVLAPILARPYVNRIKSSYRRKSGRNLPDFNL